MDIVNFMYADGDFMLFIVRMCLFLFSINFVLMVMESIRGWSS